MSRIVSLLRHCESAFNVNPTDDLSLKDCGLTPLGKSQAQSVDGEFDVCICSPLRRCRQTFELSQIVASDVRYLDLVREHRTDVCDFFEDEEIVLENEESILGRVAEFRRYILSEFELHPANRILVVSHADFLFYFTSTVFERERFGQWLKNGQILRWDVGNQLPVVEEV